MEKNEQPALIAVAVLALAALTTTSAQAKAPRCDSKAKTVAATQQIRVIAPGRGSLDSRDLWACRRPNKKAVFLFDGARNERWSSLRIAGERYVSVIGRYASPLDGIVEIDVSRIDVIKRKRSNWGTPLDRQPFGADVVLLDDGTAALIGNGVVMLSRFGQSLASPPIVVDSGPLLTELASSHSRLYWLNNGTTRSLAAGSTTPIAGPAPLATDITRPGIRASGNSRCARAEANFFSVTLSGRFLLVAMVRAGFDASGTAKESSNPRLKVVDLTTRKTNTMLDVFPAVQVLAHSGRFGSTLVPGEIKIGGREQPVATYSALPTPDLAASWGGIWWLGSDGLPRFSS